MNWLREHLKTELPYIEIINLLEKTGFPCSSVKKTHPSWHRIRIVEILEKRAHPNADKLNLYIIKNITQNATENLQIVCGDQTLQIGDCVPYMPPETIVPANGMLVKVAKIRDIESPGMLCSAHELQLLDGNKGVMRAFREDLGRTIAEAYESEAVIEIEVTPNRGDMLSIRGIARHLVNHGAGQLLEMPVIALQNNADLGEVRTEKCSALCLVSLKHQVKSVQPFIAKRLLLCGHEILNLDVVDLTNYVAHEMGHPLHAFDAEKLSGKLIVHELPKCANYKALNKKEYLLNAGTVVIESAVSEHNEIISWPGVIGGDNTKITSATTEILLEAGMFEIDSIQRRQHGIFTASAKKFEYGADCAAPVIAIGRLLYLLGVQPNQVFIQQNLQKKIIKFNLSLASRILGVELDNKVFVKLENRGFEIEHIDGDCFLITVPTYKWKQIQTANCLIEEIANYDDIKCELLPPRRANLLDCDYKDYLASAAVETGFFETVNYAITKKQQNAIQIDNYSNLNYSHLRANLYEQLLEVANWHVKNGYDYYNNKGFFENGDIYVKSQDRFSQEPVFCAISQCADDLILLWHSFLARVKLKMPQFQAQIEQEYSVQYTINKTLDDKNTKDVCVAKFFKPTEILHNIGMKTHYVLEININSLHLLEPAQSIKSSKQAPVCRDVTFLLPEWFLSGDLFYFIQQNLLISQYECFFLDLYPARTLNVARKATVRFVFHSDETMTCEHYNEQIAQIKTKVHEKFGIEAE